jgi:hypothetical protein
MMEAGALAPDEGRKLLEAMAGAPARSRLSFLVDPFERFGGGVAAALGLAISTGSIAVGRLGVRFDGFLDMHASRNHAAPLLRVALLDQGANWLLAALCFWLCARIFTRHARALDFIGMVGLARVPYLLAAIPLALLAPAASSATGAPPKMTPALVAILVIAIPCAVWMVALLYFGFKNASGLRGAKLVVGFIATTIIAEILSKVVLAAAT